MSSSETVRLVGSDNGALSTVRGGRVVFNGEYWDVASTVEQIGEIMRANKVPPNADRARVLMELQLVGYWPTRAALKDYMASVKEKAA